MHTGGAQVVDVDLDLLFGHGILVKYAQIFTMGQVPVLDFHPRGNLMGIGKGMGRGCRPGLRMLGMGEGCRVISFGGPGNGRAG